MVEPFEHSYFNWLYAKVVDPRETDPKSKYEQLLSIFHRHPFYWIVVGDDNRAEEALDLREEFMAVSGMVGEFEDNIPSVLEVLIAFARRASDTSGTSSYFWFWTMVENLGLNDMSDAAEPEANTIHEKLAIFVDRKYDALGHGGLFPLRESEYDQRFIEIWYQFNDFAYQNNLS